MVPRALLSAVLPRFALAALGPAVLTLAVLSPVPPARAQDRLPPAAADALLHVVAHEMGHAMLREFDLPILGPEEDIADDFATVLLFLALPDRAGSAVAARARQNLADAEAAGPFSEYRSDAQRAGRSVCLLYGLDPDRHGSLAQDFGLTGDEAATCRDFAPEVGRSWRRILDAHRLPPGTRATEARVTLDDSPAALAFRAAGLEEDALALLAQIDWHSQVTLAVEACDGGSSWARNGRQITVCSAYIDRFARQLGP